jgi:hypothetical protein
MAIGYNVLEETKLPDTDVILEKGDKFIVEKNSHDASVPHLNEMLTVFFRYVDNVFDDLFDAQMRPITKIAYLLDNMNASMDRNGMEKRDKVKFKMLMLKQLKLSLMADKNGEEIAGK